MELHKSYVYKIVLLNVSRILLKHLSTLLKASSIKYYGSNIYYKFESATFYAGKKS